MKFQLISITVLAAMLSSCATTKPIPRTKFSDKNMRIMIDPDSVSVEDHVRIQHALMDSGKWAVLDRSKALKAIKKEQEMLHRDEVDRFEDRQKWAHWGKLYGVGAIVIGHIQCTRELNFWRTSFTQNCEQFLNLVDANTGELITSISNSGTFPEEMGTSWVEAVAKLNDAYPKDYKPAGIKHDKLVEYEDVSAEAALRTQEGR